jgi:FkbM family methyltransferase
MSTITRAVTKLYKSLWFLVFGFVIRNLSKTCLAQSRLVAKIYHTMSSSFMGRGEVTVHVHGQTMYVDAIFGLTLESAGTYVSERFMTEIFTGLVKEGMTVVDVGAHAGYYTLIAARAVGDKGKVFAFEPEPSNYKLLLKNIQVNNHKNVVPIQKAVANVTGPVRLFMAEDASGHSIVNYNPRQRSIPVDSTTLDDYFAARIRPIHIVKIDVEGAEDAVLQGMSRIITENPELKIFTEFSPGALKRAGCLPMEYFKKLALHGFDIYLIDEKKRSLEPAEISRVMKVCKSMGYVNLLCHRGRRELL